MSVRVEFVNMTGDDIVIVGKSTKLKAGATHKTGSRVGTVIQYHPYGKASQKKSVVVESQGTINLY